MPEFQSGMGRLVADANQLRGQYGLRVGQVASPVSPIKDAQTFDTYIQQCLRTWTVDVVLDDGSYLYACRIVTPQGNTREGLRRMFKFPRQDLSERHWVGDRVVVGFLEANAATPVVLGALFPISITADPTATLAEAAKQVFVTPDQNEWRDRHEVIDYTDSTNPLPAHTERRDSGKKVEEVQEVFEAPVAGSPSDNTRNLVREFSDSAKTITHEHAVESGGKDHRTINTVYTSDKAAKDLLASHQTQTTDGNSFTANVTYQDLEARTLNLQHQVQVLTDVVNSLIMHSDQAQLLTVSHETFGQSVLIRSDGAHNNLSVVKRDKSDNSNASLQMSAHSVVVLRRSSNGQPDAWVVLDADGNAIVQSAFGSSVRLAKESAVVRSGGSSVLINDSQGIEAVSKDGGSFTLNGDAATVTAASVAVKASAITMATGALRVGAGAGNTSMIPATEKVYSRLTTLENRLADFEKWALTHFHSSNGVRPATAPNIGPTGSFSPANAQGDSLVSMKGD